jgi:hypothetical protein
MGRLVTSTRLALLVLLTIYHWFAARKRETGE